MLLDFIFVTSGRPLYPPKSVGTVADPTWAYEQCFYPGSDWTHATSGAALMKRRRVGTVN